MSSERSLSHQELVSLVLDLASRVDYLEQQVLHPQVVGSPVTVNYSVALSSSAAGPSGESTSPQVGAQLPAAPASSSAATSRSAEHTDAQRIEIAAGIGRYLRRALEGDNRGSSGRDKLKLGSRVYILVRDIRGTVYNPVQIHRAFSSLSPLVKDSQGTFGDSIFVGLPTLWEAKLAVQAASLSWPADA